MMPVAGADILVVGMAKSGLAAVELLAIRGARPRATDRKPLEEMPEVAKRLREIEVEFAVQSPSVFEGCAGIVVSPGVPADLPELAAARSRGVSVIGELELASAYL